MRAKEIPIVRFANSTQGASRRKTGGRASLYQEEGFRGINTLFIVFLNIS